VRDGAFLVLPHPIVRDVYRRRERTTNSGSPACVDTSGRWADDACGPRPSRELLDRVNDDAVMADEESLHAWGSSQRRRLSPDDRRNELLRWQPRCSVGVTTAGSALTNRRIRKVIPNPTPANVPIPERLTPALKASQSRPPGFRLSLETGSVRSTSVNL
jgi:hypothetical protein